MAVQFSAKDMKWRDEKVDSSQNEGQRQKIELKKNGAGSTFAHQELSFHRAIVQGNNLLQANKSIS